MNEDLSGKILRLVVLLPAFNEAETIGDMIRRIPRKIKHVNDVSIVVVDDGSTDNTAQEAHEAGVDYVVSLASNNGVGYAFKSGIKKALELGADIVVNMDADGQHNPDDISRLIEPILKESYDVVVGSRFLDDHKLDMPFMNRLGNRLFTKAVAWATGIHLTDSQSGFRAFSRDAALRLNTLGKFTYTQESLIELAMKNLRITEVPITVKPRKGESKVVKNCYSYGFKALAITLRALRDFRPLAFFGSLGALALMAGFSSGFYVFTHWLLTGRTSPYASLIDFTVLSSLAGLFLIVLALMADMQVRQRRIQEETLYYIKRLHYDKISKMGHEDPLKAIENLSTEDLMTIARALDRDS